MNIDNRPTVPHQTLLLTLDEVAHEIRVSRRDVEQKVTRGDLEDFGASLTAASPPGAETDAA